jgi:serine phosphatase RsbU (regulator of sigma subunit)
MKIGSSYTLELSKSGYSTITLAVDLTTVPKEMIDQGLLFKGAELILNSYQLKNSDQINQPFGRIFYNMQKGEMDFETAKFITKNQKEYINNPVSLMMRSVEKNENSNILIINKSPILKPHVKPTKTTPTTTLEIIPEDIIVKPVPNKKNLAFYDSINRFFKDFKTKSTDNFSENDIQSLESKIEIAKKQLAENRLNAATASDSLALEQAASLLNTLELELNSAKKQITVQEEKISSQRQMLLLAGACLLLLIVLLLFIYRYNKEKKKTYLILKDKNKKITDSINYAQRIQESVLPSKEDIKKQLPESFVFYQPRDIVSGDFYWLSTIRDKTIIACVDCTGHGVPGAFMSLIGNTLLNEIVNEKEITNAAAILKNLHMQVSKVLHQNTGNTQNKDGMEMGLCVIDKSRNELEFAGAMHPLYLVKDNAISVIKPDIKGIGGDFTPNQEIEFKNQLIPLEKGLSVYLFTDGYMDQFGGPENKKFNIANFKKMLLEIQSMDMEKQQEVVSSTIQKWQGAQKQIDDMLVIGVRF